MLSFSLCFFAGLLLVQLFSHLPSLSSLFILGSVAAIAALFRHGRCTFFLIGVLWASGFGLLRLQHQLPASVEGINIPIQGIIANLPQQDARRASFIFEINPPKGSLPRRLKLSWYYPKQALKAGQRWAFTVNLKRPHGQFNLGGFDYERWLFEADIGATGTVRPKSPQVLIGQDSALTSITVLRQIISDQFNAVLPDNPSRAVLKALTIGDANDISQARWEVFRKTGTIHLIVISGSHISLIAGLLYWLVLKIWASTGILRYAPPQVAALVASFAAIVYAQLAGFSLPTQRAVLMFVLLMWAITVKRHTNPLSLLAITMSVILIFEPFAVNSPSFWLTFFFVAVIGYSVGGRLRTLPPLSLEVPKNRLGKLRRHSQQAIHLFEQVFKINLALALMPLPLLSLFFQQISLVSPLANFFAVPLMSFIVVPLSLLLVPLLFVAPSLAVNLFYFLDECFKNFEFWLTRLADAPLLTLITPDRLSFVLALLGMAILFAPRGLPARGLGAVLLLPLLLHSNPKPPRGEVKLTLLDVGQGLAVAVQTAQHTLIYDTGGKFSDDFDSGKSVVLPFLQHQGITKIDRLIISHGDNDHSGGAASLLNELPVDSLLTSVPEKFQSYAAQRCTAGQTWQYDGVIFRVLSPQQAFESENDNSCVLQIETAHGAALLTGDIEATAEVWLVEQYGDKLKAKVLIAPHHGSRSSSSLAFLQAVSPEFVLIPAGYRNRFHHPAPEVLQRYQHIAARYLSSANSGAITVNLGSVFSVSALRDTDSRYWHFKP